MLKMLRNACKDSNRQMVNYDEVELSDTEEFHDEESDEGEKQASKQVRFSSGLPPTRQSRYGPEDGEEGPEFSSLPTLHQQNPDQSVLRKGSASSTGFRRRQVSRLMSLQEPVGHSESNGRISTSRQSAADKAFVMGGLQIRYVVRLTLFMNCCNS